jgi:CO dehydrogenase nickel-insertion accessory protein CooC1
MTFVGALSFNPEVVEADIKGLPPYEVSKTLLNEIKEIREEIEGHIARA